MLPDFRVRQRDYLLEITRALVISPQFILLDEPFAGVDPIAVEEHVFGAAQADARGAEGARHPRFFRRVGIGAHLQPLVAVGQRHQRAEVAAGPEREVEFLAAFAVALMALAAILVEDGLDVPGKIEHLWNARNRLDGTR